MDKKHERKNASEHFENALQQTTKNPNFELKES